MNKSDIEFTVGLNTSPAEQKLNNLFKDTQTAQGRLQKLLNSTQSEQVYESKIAKLEKLQTRLGVDSISSARSLPQNEYNRFVKLSNDIARYERNLNKYTDITSKVISASNSYTESKSRTDIHPNLGKNYLTRQLDDEVARLATNRNKIAAEGAYEQFKKITTPSNILALPAPNATDKRIDSILYSDNSSVERWYEKAHKPFGFTNTLSGKITDEDLAEENKKDNIELKNKLLLWGKIFAVVYGIRKLIQGMAKLWKFGADTVTGVNKNINEETGFFSVDTVGALRANTDKTRAALYAGIRAMGGNAPLTKSDLDYAPSKMEEAWQKAMSGQSVDAQYSIAAQWIKDFYGTDLTVEGLLTGEREGKTATDLQIDLFNKIESKFGEYAKLDKVQQGYIRSALITMLGPNAVNALMAQANKNLLLPEDERMSLIDLLLSHGGSAFHSQNLVASTKDAVDSISELSEAMASLKNTLVQQFAPAFSDVTKGLSNIIDFINGILNKDKGAKDAIGNPISATSISAITSSRYDYYKDITNKGLFANDNDIADVFKNKEKRISELQKSENAYDILDAIILSQPKVQNAASIEAGPIRQMEKIIGRNILRIQKARQTKEGANADFDPNSNVDMIRDLFYEVGGYDELMKDPVVRRIFSGYDQMTEAEQLTALSHFVKDTEIGQKLFGKYFGKGGKYDYDTSMSPSRYRLNPMFYESFEEWFEAFRAYEENINVQGYGGGAWNMNIRQGSSSDDGTRKLGTFEFDVTAKDQESGKRIKTETFTAEIFTGAVQ